MKLRIMLVDDFAPFREAMRMFLELQEDIEVVFEVANANDFLEAYRESRIDVVCMDVGLQGLDGAELTRQLLAFAPEARVVGLSGHTELQSVAQLVDAGALGYVIKGSPSEQLLRAIRAASRYQIYFDTGLNISTRLDLQDYFKP
jgi:DNA-binding NarL/FixJ family response regulator